MNAVPVHHTKHIFPLSPMQEPLMEILETNVALVARCS